jgi:protein-S-isoprenylcysteine O-methyltransferase Ste14
MTKLHALLTHLVTILALMFLVFLVLDQFNPLMDFVDNSISRGLLALLCLGGVAGAICTWREADKGGKPHDENHTA